MQTGPESDFLGAGTGQEQQHGASAAPEDAFTTIKCGISADNEQAWQSGFAECSVGRKVD